MKFYKNPIVFVLLVCNVLTSNAQAWKKYRLEVFGGLGPTFFLGEVGGRNQEGRDFLTDLDINTTRYALAIGARYNISPWNKLRTQFTHAVVSGSDANTEYLLRRNRNLRFKTDIYEYGFMLEHYLNAETSGDKYKVRGTRGMKNVKFTFYGFAGINIMFFNPRNLYNGKWVSLHPLNTEGQGLPGGPAPYSRFGINIPFGAGIRYNITRNLRFSAELSIRKLFTDYVDDISGFYYDNNKLRELKGDMAADLADPSLGLIEGYSNTGEIRGDPTDKDNYFFIQLQLAYRFRKKVARAKF